MESWWNSIPSFERVFWCFAIPFSVVFVIQLILTFSGMGGDGDMDMDGDVGDADMDADGLDSPFHFFTVRNFIIFFTVFGWTGITLYRSGASEAVTVIISVLLGLIVMLIVASLFYLVNRLAESGNVDIHNAKGAIGEVYIPIPAKKSGTGKIHITFQGSLREINAMTKGEMLPTGTVVKVVDILEGHILLVEKLK